MSETFYREELPPSHEHTPLGKAMTQVSKIFDGLTPQERLDLQQFVANGIDPYKGVEITTQPQKFEY